MGGLVGCGEREVARVVALQHRAAVRYDPEQASLQDGVGETEGAQVADDGPEMSGVAFIEVQGGGVAHEDPAIDGFPEPVDIPTVAQDVHPVEAAVFLPESDTVIRPGPECSLLVQEDGVHLVVGKAQRIVRSKVLVVFVDAELIESPAGRNPDMSVGVFGEGIHFLVR